MIFARKNNKTLEFYMMFARKMPEFYIIIALKYFFPNFRGGARAPLPPSPTPTAIAAGGWTRTNERTLTNTPTNERMNEQPTHATDRNTSWWR